MNKLLAEAHAKEAAYLAAMAYVYRHGNTHDEREVYWELSDASRREIRLAKALQG